MPIISEFEGIEIYMYNNGREHNPPHFHAVYGEKECVIDINSIRKMEGSFPRNKLRMVLVWCELHREELLSNWDKCLTKKTLASINPLKR